MSVILFHILQNRGPYWEFVSFLFIELNLQKYKGNKWSFPNIHGTADVLLLCVFGCMVALPHFQGGGFYYVTGKKSIKELFLRGCDIWLAFCLMLVINYGDEDYRIQGKFSM